MTDVEEVGSEGRSVQADPIQPGLVTFFPLATLSISISTLVCCTSYSDFNI